MAQKEDVLFCKIAIQNGLVSAQNAQKVLALCDKREKEAGRRPPIGAVFSKYNLMRTRDVDLVYEALRKRAGGGGGNSSSSRSAASRSGFKSGVRSGSRAGSRGGRSGVSRSGVGSGSTLRARAAADTAALETGVVKVERRVDNLTLALGIGGLLVVVVIICVIAFLMFSGKGAHDAKEPTVAKQTREETQDLSESVKKFLAPTKKTETQQPAEAAPVAPVAVTELPDHVRGKVLEIIADARGMMSDDPAKALEILEAQEKDVTAQGFQVPPNLREAIAQARDAARATPAPAAAPTAEAAPGSAAPAPKEGAAGS